MRKRSLLFAHVVAYTAALTFAACGSSDFSVGAQNTSGSNAAGDANTQSPGANDANGLSGTGDGNSLQGNTVSPNTTNAGNGNVSNSNATNTNATNTNNTVSHLDCNNTWTSYASAFFTNNCANCHTHNHSNLTDFNHVVGIEPTLQNFISTRVMPVGTTLSGQDYNAILTWFACKMPH